MEKLETKIRRVELEKTIAWQREEIERRKKVFDAAKNRLASAQNELYKLERELASMGEQS